jgi:glucose-6-phosphate 1-epimerase
MAEAESVEALETRFGRPGLVRFERAGELFRVVVTAPRAEAHVYLQGAHVTHYQPRGQAPILFLSRRSAFSPGQAIRGGVPLCFPWFGAKAGDGRAPMHGFARTAPWTLTAVEATGDGTVALELRLEPHPATRRLWPHDFVAWHRVVVGSALELGLEVENAGAEPLGYEAALHTYLALGDVRSATLSGLAGTTYIDKTDGQRRKVEGPAPVQLDGETDRVYLGTRAASVVDDPVGGRRLVVEKDGSDVTVVWNPWAEKARAMPDLGDEEWTGFVCVETAQAADHAVTLAPGARHRILSVIRAESRS